MSLLEIAENKAMNWLLTKSFESLKRRIEKTSSNGQEETKKLNDKYRELQTTSEKWEYWKKLISEFYKQKSILLRSICSKDFSKVNVNSICQPTTEQISK